MQASRIGLAIGGLIAIVLFFGTAPAGAQVTGASSDYGVRAQTGDAEFHVGWSDLRFDSTSRTRTATVLGGSAGYNATEHAAVLGEYQYARQGNANGFAVHGLLYGAALRYSLRTDRVAPYVLGGGGGIRESAGAYGVNASADGWYAAFGGGVSLFLGRHWGVRPEFRYHRGSLSAGGISTGLSLYQVTGGVFCQFGNGLPKGSGRHRSAPAQGRAQ